MNRWLSALAAALLAVPAVASAQGGYTGSSMDEEDKFNVQLQGGIGGWTGNAGDATTDVGPAYGVLGSYNQNSWLSYELGYVGHTNGISDTDSQLTSNKIQLDLKAGPELSAPVTWRPYLFAGVAANFVAAGNTPTATFDDGVQGMIPLGAGVDFFSDSPVQVGARGTFDLNSGVSEDIGPISENPSAWQAAITASAAF